MSNGHAAADQIEQLLGTAKRIAVVGLSDNPSRDSYRVAEYLLRHGYQVIPVNPSVDEVLGRKAFKTLSEVPGAIDIVNVFRKSDAVLPIAQEAIHLGAKALWLQLGVVHEEAAKQARSAGLIVVQDRCIKIDHAALQGSR